MIDSTVTATTIGDFYDDVVDHYATEERTPTDYVDMICRCLRLRPGSRVLDVGCGTGALAHALATRGLYVDAVDQSPQMIDIARGVNAHPAVRYECRGVADGPLDRMAYAAVIALESFHLLPEPALIVDRFEAALAPGGSLAVGWLAREWEDVARCYFVPAITRHGLEFGPWEYWGSPHLIELLAGRPHFSAARTDVVRVPTSVSVAEMVRVWMSAAVTAPLAGDERGALERDLYAAFSRAFPLGEFYGSTGYSLRWFRKQ